jgi:hypothetical protein
MGRIKQMSQARSDEASYCSHRVAMFVQTFYPVDIHVRCAAKVLKDAGDDVDVLRLRASERRQRALPTCLGAAHGSVGAGH